MRTGVRIFVLLCACTLVGSVAAAQATRVIALQDAPVRLFPDRARAPFHTIPNGATLSLIAIEQGWLLIEFQDSRLGARRGYVERTTMGFPPAAAESGGAPAPTAAPATAPPPAISSGQVITFRKVDYAELDGERERSRSARLVFDPGARTLTFSDEGGGEAEALYAKIPYASITKIVYEQSAHRRYGAGVMVSPLLFFTKGKKHWLTIEFKDVTALPQGFVYARLDKDNYRQILSALRAGTGVTVEEHIEN